MGGGARGGGGDGELLLVRWEGPMGGGAPGGGGDGGGELALGRWAGPVGGGAPDGGRGAAAGPRCCSEARRAGPFWTRDPSGNPGLEPRPM